MDGMRRVSFSDEHCSVARALDLVGDWWTLMIVRDLSLGLRRFDQIQADLGISRNVLTERLEMLVDNEIVSRTNIARTGTRYEYRLTEKGRDLIPVLFALIEWGDKWNPDPRAPYTEIVHTVCDHVTVPVPTCSHCGEVVHHGELTSRPGPAWIDDPDHPIARARRDRQQPDRA